MSAPGPDIAYRAVTASAAMAIQDAVDAHRHACTIATTACGVALAQFLASGDPRYLDALAESRAMVDKAAGNFAAISAAAIKLVADFPCDHEPGGTDDDKA
jgi:hypothetical protein